MIIKTILEENIKYNQKTQQTIPQVPEECLAESPMVQH